MQNDLNSLKANFRHLINNLSLHENTKGVASPAKKSLLMYRTIADNLTAYSLVGFCISFVVGILFYAFSWKTSFFLSTGIISFIMGSIGFYFYSQTHKKIETLEEKDSDTLFIHFSHYPTLSQLFKCLMSYSQVAENFDFKAAFYELHTLIEKKDKREFSKKIKTYLNMFLQYDQAENRQLSASQAAEQHGLIFPHNEIWDKSDFFEEKPQQPILEKSYAAAH